MVMLCKGQNQLGMIVIPKTDTGVLKKWFPNLEGIESANWEVKVLSSNSGRVPGPSAFQSKGVIYLEKDIAEKYLNDYEWNECNLQIAGEYIDVTEFVNKKWYYSEKFEEVVKPNSYIGNFYFNGEVVWFDVTR